MKKIGGFMVVIGIITLVFMCVSAVVTSYEYSKKVESYWMLADKSSTITEKSRNIDLFVTQFSNEKYKGAYDAVVFKTPDNSFDANFKALTSLQLRLHEIQTMDINSFEYQTAIQQITAQEQGEARQMLQTLESIWYRVNYWYLWDWFAFLIVLFASSFIVVGFFIKLI